MNAVVPFRTIVDLVTSVSLDPTSTVCAIALLLVASLAWRLILVRDAAAGARGDARRRRRRAPHDPAHPRPPTPRSPGPLS